MEKKRFDVVRPWFDAAEQLGEYIGIRYGQIRPGQTEPEWLFFSHAVVDGIGAFARLLRERGATLEVLPQIKYYPAYSAIGSAITHWPRYLAPRREVKWKEFGSSKASETIPNQDARRPPLALAWHVFDEATSYRIRQDSRKIGVTVNTFLLDNLNRAIRPSLQDPGAIVPWMVPVNMRGGVTRAVDTDNHTSYVAVNIHPRETTADIHRKLLQSLSKGEHWGNWHAFKLGLCLTASMRKRLVQLGRCISQWNLGVFSNLGEWDADKTISNPDILGGWLFCPPTLRTQRVAAGCLTFQGRLSLTIQAHPELTTDVAIPRGWMKGWLCEIEKALVRISVEAGVPSLAA